MKRQTYFNIAGAILVLLVAYFVLRPPAATIQETNADEFYLSTEGQSNDRVKSLNLDQASEDARYILDPAKLVVTEQLDFSRELGDGPDPERDWILRLRQVHGGQFKHEDLLKLFDYDWRVNFRSEIYGYSPQEKRWTYALAGGVLQIFDSIEIAISLQQVFGAENADFAPYMLLRYADELDKRIKKYPTEIDFEILESPKLAIRKAQKIVKLHREFDHEAVIVLANNQPFPGAKVWDALICLGLKWGDGDLFHWENSYWATSGGDYHFSVWTSTEPGYFLPEEIQNGTMNPSDLVFGFSIPRSVDPENVFAMMLDAVKYCQKRLGGKLLDAYGLDLDEAKEKARISELVKRMRANGIYPGGYNALVMF